VGLQHRLHAFGCRHQAQEANPLRPARISALTAATAEPPSRAWVEQEERAIRFARGILK